jgi:hypothetical protein
MHTKVVVATVAAFALGAAGCGSAGPLTAAELSRQASAICKQRNTEIAALRPKYHDNVKAMAVAAVPTEITSVEGLAKLKPPKSARASYERFVGIEQIYLRELKAHVAGRASSSGTTPDRTHEVGNITERLHIAACG